MIISDTPIQFLGMYFLQQLIQCNHIQLIVWYKVNRGNPEYTYKKFIRLHTRLTIIEAFYAREFLTLRITSRMSLIASRLWSQPRGHNMLSYAEIT